MSFLGFQLQVDKFFIFFVTLFLTSLSASSVAFCISGLVRVSAIGSSLIAIAFVIQMASVIKLHFTACIDF